MKKLLKDVFLRTSDIFVFYLLNDPRFVTAILYFCIQISIRKNKIKMNEFILVKF